MKKITYHFKLEDTNKHTFVLQFDEKTMLFQAEEKDTQGEKDWTKLSNNQCTNCPLNEEEYPRCPVAENLHDVVFAFRDLKSFVPTQVVVETQERAYMKKASLQEGLYSIFGLVMATSACPHMKIFRLAASHHLPFATQRESMIRNLSFFLLNDLVTEGPDSSQAPHLKGFLEALENVSLVNRGILERVRAITTGDAELNALTLLDGFTYLLSSDLPTFEEIKTLIPSVDS